MKFQLQNFLESLELGLNGDREGFFMILEKSGLNMVSSVAVLKCMDNEFLNEYRTYVNRNRGFLSCVRRYVSTYNKSSHRFRLIDMIIFENILNILILSFLNIIFIDFFVHLNFL